MSHFSRNFLIHALPFVADDFQTMTSVEFSLVLATSSSFMSGSLAPELVIKMDLIPDPPLFLRPSWRYPSIFPLLLDFSWTVQFATDFRFSGTRGSGLHYDGEEEFNLFPVKLIHETRYFTRQLVRLELCDVLITVAHFLPFLRGLRELRLKFSFDLLSSEIMTSESVVAQREEDLLSGLQHLDLDVFDFTLYCSVQNILSTILETIWTRNPMRRLHTFKLDWVRELGYCVDVPKGLDTEAISDFQPDLLKLSLRFPFANSVPDLSRMNHLKELHIADCTKLRHINRFFRSPPNPPTRINMQGETIPNCHHCSRLTKLSFDVSVPNTLVMLFVGTLGYSEHMKVFEFNTARSAKFSSGVQTINSNDTGTSCFPDGRFLTLLISRYPRLEVMNLSQAKLRDSHFKLIGEKMGYLKELILPSYHHKCLPWSTDSLAWIFDPSRNASGCRQTIEKLCLSSLQLGYEHSLHSDVFGSECHLLGEGDHSHYRLKNLQAHHSIFRNAETFFNFIKYFSSSLETVTLPRIDSLGKEEDDTHHHHQSDEKLPRFPNLKSIILDWGNMKCSSYSAILGPLARAAPYLQHFSVNIIPDDEDPIRSGNYSSWWVDPRKEKETPFDDLADLFQSIADNLDQDCEREFLTLDLNVLAAIATSEEGWNSISRIKSLRRVEVTPECPGVLPKSKILFVKRSDVSCNFPRPDENDENHENDDSDVDKKSESLIITEEKSIPQMKLAAATTGKKKVVANKKLATKKPVAKKTAKKSTKKTTAAGKKKKVVPKKATKAKKPVAKKTTSTKKKPTAKKSLIGKKKK